MAGWISDAVATHGVTAKKRKTNASDTVLEVLKRVARLRAAAVE